MCRLFPCISIFGGFFRLKRVKKMGFVINLKNPMRPMKSVFINVKKGIRNTYYLYTSSDKDIIKDKI